MATIGTRFLAGVALALLAVSPSWARVGVASVVDGEPRGLPPAGTERILKIGNDMDWKFELAMTMKPKDPLAFRQRFQNPLLYRK